MRYSYITFRPRKIDLPFCLYHVMQRTNSGDIVFEDSRDKSRFLNYLAKYINLFEFTSISKGERSRVAELANNLL